jgi:outer membrane protein assembly factor BamA
MPVLMSHPTFLAACDPEAGRREAAEGGVFGVGPLGLVLALLLLGGALASPAARAQDRSGPVAAHSRADTTAGGPIIRRVEIRGNRYFSDGEIKQRVRTAPNRRILGIPGLTWWRWIYQFGSKDWMWNRLGRALRSSGEPPAAVDSTTLSDDLERLRLFYEQQGFREASVDVRVERTGRPDRVAVVFSVEPGPPTYVRRVRYEGVDVLDREQKQRLAEDIALEDCRPGSDRPLAITCEEQRYQKPVLLDERRRLLTFLRNEGYAAVTRDSIRALIYEPAPDTFDITFRVRPGARYRFGDVRLSIDGPEERVRERTDTLAVANAEGRRPEGGYRPSVSATIRNESHLSTGMLRRSLQFTPGAYYDRSEVLATKRRLEGTGVFTFTNIRSDPSQAVRADSLDAPYLPIRIEGRTRARHRVRAETFALQREVVSDIENELGVGVGLTYENANAFGGGETFRVQSSGSVGVGIGIADLQSWQAEASTSLTLPYLIRPFDRFERLFDLRDARTRLSLSFLSARREELGLRIRGRGSARLRLEMEHTPSLTSFVDVADVSLSNPDPLPGFEEQFLCRIIGTDTPTADCPDDAVGRITDPVQIARITEDYTQPQINVALRYTLRSTTANLLRREQGHIYEGIAEVGNTLPRLLDRFAFSPNRVQYALPGLGADSLVYRPYVRFVADARRYLPLSSGTTLALKAYGGWAHPTGEPPVVPFDRRFFSGGATSVRGWRLRDLGPGDASLNTTASPEAAVGGTVSDGTTTGGEGGSGGADGGVGSGGVANILGGDVKLELSAELRTTLFRNILDARWVGATFVDVGNVWFGPRNPALGGDGNGGDGRFRVPSFLSEVGVGSGLGIRFVWEYLIVRFDLAYKVHAPAPGERGIFVKGLEDPLLHFGIGHTF